MSKASKIFLAIYVGIIYVFLAFGFLAQIFSLFEINFNLEESTGPNDYARITDVDYKAVLVDNATEGNKMVITEKLTFDIHAANKNNLYWELWRDLPEDYVDGLNVHYKVNYVKQLNDNGTEKIYQESPKLYWDDIDYTGKTYGPGKWYHSKGPYNEDQARYECVFFYVNGLYREQVTFEVQYELYNAALKYNDVSELYLTMYSEETIKHLKSFEGEILIPNEDMPNKNNYLAHTFGTNTNTFEHTESSTKNPGYYTFSFSLDEDDLKFKPYNKYLEFTLLAYGPDKHIFTNYAPRNFYSHENYLEEAQEEIKKYDELPKKFKYYKALLFIASIIISTIIIYVTLNKDKSIKKKNTFYEPNQQIDYYREIPSDLDPYFAAQLVFSKEKPPKDTGEGYSALLLNLERKKYVKLLKIDNTKDWSTNNIQIKILYNPIKAEIITQTTEPITEINNSTNNSIKYVPIFPTQAGDTSFIINDIDIPNVETLTNVTETPNKIINTQPQTEPQQLININNEILEPLSQNEESYFNLIRRHALNQDYITMSDFQSKVSSDYDYTSSFVTKIDSSIINIGVSKGYFQKADYNKIKSELKLNGMRNIIFGLITLILGNIIILQTRFDLAYGALFILGITLFITGIYLKKISKKYILLTQFGENEYAKWRGLYNFLNSKTLMEERTIIELPLWEKYLVYATAFGISEKIIKAIDIRCPEAYTSEILNSNSYCRSSSFRTSSHSFRTSTHHAHSVSRSYHSGSYYGGGGRGGGGGGGGH